MTGKEKCNHLRQLREQIARENGIPYESTPCNYQGDDCIGTCPKCEEELRYLTNALQEKLHRGEPVTPKAEWELLLAHYSPSHCPEDFTAETDDVEFWDGEPPFIMPVNSSIPEMLAGGVLAIDPEEEERKRKEALARWDGDTTVCPFCGRSHRPDARFCIGCGQRLPEATACQRPPESNVPELRVCPHCGTFQTSAMVICEKCGAVLNGPAVATNQAAPLPPVGEMLDTLHNRVGRLLAQEDQNQIQKLKDGLDRMIRWVEQLEQETKDERSARERRAFDWKWEQDFHLFDTPGVMVSDDE